MENELEIIKEKAKAESQLARIAEARNIIVGNSNAYQITMLAEKFAAAKDMVPKEYQNSPEKCFAALFKGASLGLDPMTSLQRISVINGRTTIWGDTALALVRKSKLMTAFKEEITKDKNGKMIATCLVRREEEDDHISVFTQEQAENAGLWGRNVWRSYPERMLKYRARAFALRDIFPDVIDGLYFKEEMEGEAVQDVTPTPIATPDEANEPRVETVMENIEVTDE